MLNAFTDHGGYQTFPKATKEAIKRGQLVQLGGAADALQARSFAPTAYLATPTTTPLVGVALRSSSAGESTVSVVLHGEADIQLSPLDATNYNAQAPGTFIDATVNPTDGLVGLGVAGSVPVRKRINPIRYRAGSVFLDNSGTRYARVFL